MVAESIPPDRLWRYYQRGYHCLVRNGLYFRDVLRPALSHVYFQRAVPLLVTYARVSRGQMDLPPGFGEQLQACPLTPRDLAHLDYAICLGYAEESGRSAGVSTAPMLDLPTAAAALFAELGGLDDLQDEMEKLDSEESDENEPKPPFDL